MDSAWSWFASAPSLDACDYIGKGIAETRRVTKAENEQRQAKIRQLEIAATAGKIDKATFEAAQKQVQVYTKDNVDYDDALIVLAVLGSRLVELGVVNHSQIHGAHDAVRQAFQSVGGSKFYERFDRLDQSVQIGVVCGMNFCAECYPMHIWRGFGAALLSNYSWATYHVSKMTWDYLDQSISFLKSSPHSYVLFKSIPEGMERMKPWYRENEKKNNELAWKAAKKDRKALEAARLDFTKRSEKKGFPEPIDKSYSVNSWSIVFATWDSQYSINNEGHSWVNVVREQMDPGRLFHAFVIGGHLTLRDEEVLIIPAGPAECLARWLQGLDGMTFKLIPHTTLNFKKIGLKSSTLKVMQTLQGKDGYAMRDAAAVKRKQDKALSRVPAANPPPPFITRAPTEPMGAAFATSPVEKVASPVAESSAEQSNGQYTPPPGYPASGQTSPVVQSVATASSEYVAAQGQNQNSGVPFVLPAGKVIPPMPMMPGDKRMSMPVRKPSNASGSPEVKRASMGPGSMTKVPDYKVTIEDVPETETSA